MIKKGLILQYDSRGIVYPDLCQRNYDYALKRGYEYKFVYPSKYPDIPPYWQKVFLVRDFLEEYSWVFWIDSDACVHNTEIEIPELSSKEDIVISPDMPPWKSKFNAGVFLVKNTPISIKIIGEWTEGYKPDSWKKNGKQWKCHSVWAGEDYEQGYFCNHILNSEMYKKNIKILSWSVYNTPCQHHINNQTFCIHFAGGYKRDIKNYISDNKTAECLYKYN